MVKRHFADECKRLGPVEMSCPNCCAVRPAVEIREMMCAVCCTTWQTPEQFDSSLSAARKAREEAKR